MITYSNQGWFCIISYDYSIVIHCQIPETKLQISNYVLKTCTYFHYCVLINVIASHTTPSHNFWYYNPFLHPLKLQLLPATFETTTPSATFEKAFPFFNLLNHKPRPATFETMTPFCNLWNYNTFLQLLKLQTIPSCSLWNFCMFTLLINLDTTVIYRTCWLAGCFRHVTWKCSCSK